MRVTASQKPPRFPLDQRFGYRFHMISRALGQQMQSHVAREYGLNIAQYRIMTVLASHRSPSVRDIAAHTDLDKAQVTRALASLAKRGLANQRIDSRDRRLREVRLTAAGAAIIDELEDFVVARQKRLERRLTPGELEVLWKAMAILSDEIDRMQSSSEQTGPGRPRRLAVESSDGSSPRRSAR